MFDIFSYISNENQSFLHLNLKKVNRNFLNTSSSRYVTYDLNER